MTDITELTSVQKNANIHRLSRLIACAPNDELCQLAVEVEQYTDQLIEALEKAQTINAAAEKLVRCKGRYHSELNYRALADLFGVTMPDLPPLDGECRTVTVKLPQAVSAGGQGYQAQVERILTAAGIKVEAE